MENSFDALIPMVCVVLAALASMGAEAFRPKGARLPIGGLGVVGLVGAAIAATLLWGRGETSVGVIVADDFSLFVTFVLVVIGILTILFSSQVIDRDGIPAGEYYALTLFAIAGMIMIVMAADLLVVFLALEILSLAVYVLTAIRRDSAQGSEAAFKYFLLGAFSSAFFLYGIAFTYGITGSTRLDVVATALAAPGAGDNPMVLIAMGLLLVGFAFKISAVPFHMWTPDAYEGAPAVVTGFMSTAVKAAAFAVFARVFLSVFGPFSADWVGPIWVIAIATMVLGTVVGVVQTNLKRMLAYSSIAHGGYLLVGLVTANEVGRAAILFYLLAYAVTNVAAFGVIAMLGTKDDARDELRDYSGLWHSRPALAALMTVCLLSLGGLPPTAGFIGKWYIFSAAVSEGYYGLAVIGMLTSVISVFFYLRVVVMMYMSDRDDAVALVPISRVGMATVAIAVAAIFYLGILPTRVLDLAAASVIAIF
jgi:NADH-quinone oxidoreductase subunit N